MHSVRMHSRPWRNARSVNNLHNARFDRSILVAAFVFGQRVATGRALRLAFMNVSRPGTARAQRQTASVREGSGRSRAQLRCAADQPRVDESEITKPLGQLTSNGRHQRSNLDTLKGPHFL